MTRDIESSRPKSLQKDKLRDDLCDYNNNRPTQWTNLSICCHNPKVLPTAVGACTHG